MIYETQEQLDAALVKWQAILRLQDWTIRASLVAHHDGMIDNAKWNVEGQSATMVKEKASVIRLNSADCCRASTYPEFHDRVDQEVTLVHELMHLHLNTFEPPERDRLKHDLWEQHIQVMAEQFVMLERLASPRMATPASNGRAKIAALVT